MQNKEIKNPILGAIAGDMIGSPYEFLEHRVKVASDFPLWSKWSRFTDDTVMTLAVAQWLIDRPLNSNHLIECMQELGQKYYDAGYGGHFRTWLQEDHPLPYNSWGNGSAMRVSPVACAFNNQEAVEIVAEMSAAVSHNHPEGIKGAKAVADLILNGLNGRYPASFDDRERLIRYVAYKFQYDISKTPQEIRDNGYTFKVSCQKSVPEAICCFINSDSYEQTVREAVLLRGDTDTQAAIAGSIAAAHWGIPRDIADEALERLPKDLYNILEKFSKKYNLEL